MAKIEFEKNYNSKLSNKVFTTIRKYTIFKEEWYRERIGKKWDIDLNGMHLGQAVLRAVDWEVLGNVPTGLIASDTGITNKEDNFKHLHKLLGVDTKDCVLILTFERCDE